MILFQQFAAAALLVALTLCLQCAGVAVTVEWLRTVAIKGVRKLPIAHSAALVMQTTLAVIFSARRDYFSLGRLLSPNVLVVVAISLLLFSSQLFDGRIWRRGAPIAMAAVGPSREHDGRADVRDLGKPAVCAHQSAARRQDTGSASESIMNMTRSSWSRLPSGALPVDEARHA